MIEMPEVVPASVTLMDFDGRDTVRFPSKKKGIASTTGRGLTLTGEVEMDSKSTSPPEVAELSDAIRASPLFQTELPRVPGANVRMQNAQGRSTAKIVVHCLAAES